MIFCEVRHHSALQLSKINMEITEVRSLIIPCGKLEGTITLSPNDCIMLKCYTRVLYYFQSENREDTSFMDAQTLQSSLQILLEHYPILGGKLVVLSDGELEVRPNNVRKFYSQPHLYFSLVVLSHLLLISSSLVLLSIYDLILSLSPSAIYWSHVY